ncbi:MAG: endonuclease [Lentisphaerae bacterium RIFOXYA12_FULL_48_11]|nr:MAG: endonuclease [Lentisphaerae bacterium RIFOXYA12_FULL_48_11]
MRLLFYNIRYATGGKRLIFPWSGYLKKTSKNLRSIISFMKKLDPDIIGLAEVDAGSYRSQKKNQAQTIASALSHRHTYMSKYDKFSLAHMFPIMNKQGNAFLTKDSIENAKFHYFDKGVKRLVIQLELKDLTVFLVHLALGYRVRQHQLADLYSMVKGSKKPHIVAGDFNSRWGDREIKLFLAATGLTSADPSATPTYPSWKPKRQLDFILYSPHIKVTGFAMPRVTLSDHLPLVCDFEIKR